MAAIDLVSHRRAAGAQGRRHRDLQALPRRVLARPRQPARVPREVRQRADAGRLPRLPDSRRSTAAPGSAMREGGLILETIHANGGSASACHAQMYIMGTVLRHGSEAAEAALPAEDRHAASCACRPSASPSPTPAPTRRKLKTTAVRKGDRYVVNGRKMFISRAHAVRPDAAAGPHHAGRAGQAADRRAQRLPHRHPRRSRAWRSARCSMMMNHSTNALFFDDVEIPADSLVGEEGKGFQYILSGMNAERILVASESIGDGRWFTEKSVAYSRPAGDLRQADRRQPGRAVPDRQGLHQRGGRRPHARQGRRAVRRRRAVRGRGQHGQATWRPRRRGRRATPASIVTVATAMPRSMTWSASSASAASTRRRP